MSADSGESRKNTPGTDSEKNTPEDPRVARIKGRLMKFEDEIRDKVKKGDRDKVYEAEMDLCLKSVRDKLNKSSGYPLTELLETCREDRRYLSDQIDERSREIWSLGALFVPISFLIFAQAVTIIDVSYSSTLLLMFLLEVASLTCYSLWFYIYRRAHRYNVLSYPRIHVLETVLGYSQHLHLNYLREKRQLPRRTPEGFAMALFILFVLWTLYILTSIMVFADRFLLVALVTLQSILGFVLVMLFGDP